MVGFGTVCREMDESFTRSIKLGKEEGEASLEIDRKHFITGDEKETVEVDVSSEGETTTGFISEVKLPDDMQQLRKSNQLENELSEGHDVASIRERDISISEERTARQQKLMPQKTSRHKRHKFKRRRNLDPFHALMSSAQTESSNMDTPVSHPTVDTVGSSNGFTEAFEEVLKFSDEANKTAGEKPAELQEEASMAEFLPSDKPSELDKAFQKLSKEKNESSQNKDTLASVGLASEEQTRDTPLGENNDASQEVNHNTLQSDSTLSREEGSATDIPILDSLKENYKSQIDNPLQSKEDVPKSDFIVDSKGSDISKAVVGESKVVADESEAVADETKAVADKSKAVADESKAVADEMKAVADESKVVADEPKAVADESKAVADETKAVADESEAVADETKAVADESKAVADETKAVADKSKAVADESKAVADETKAVADETKAVADETKAVADESKAVADESKAVADESKVVADEPKAVADESKAVTDETKAVTDESKAVADDTKAVADVKAVFWGEKPDNAVDGGQVLQAEVRQEKNDDWPQESALISSLKQRAISGTLKVGLLNMEAVDLQRWQSLAGEMPISVPFERVSEEVEWSDLYPEWIDEEERYGTPECRSIPLPKLSPEVKLDVVIARAPCTASSTLQECWKHPASLQVLLGP